MLRVLNAKSFMINEWNVWTSPLTVWSAPQVCGFHFYSLEESVESLDFCKHSIQYSERL